MNKERPSISDTEMEILHTLWDGGPATVREVMGRLVGERKKWAYTTVQTLLGRLRDKGFVARDEQGLAHVFRAAVTREELIDARLAEIASSICGGRTSPLMMSLVQGGRLSEAELESLRELIDQAPARPPKNKKSRSKRGPG